jgi:hypothetical protein
MEHELTEEELEAPLDPETEADIDRAMATARDFDPDERATSVSYIASDDLFVLVLRSGARIAIPREDLQDVANLSSQDAAKMALTSLDTAIEWPEADIGFRVKGLADGVRGNERWMKKLAERNQPKAA